jgi:hypothetical protein
MYRESLLSLVFVPFELCGRISFCRETYRSTGTLLASISTEIYSEGVVANCGVSSTPYHDLHGILYM